MTPGDGATDSLCLVDINAVLLAALFVCMTATQLSALDRDFKKLRLLAVVLLGCEIVALALLAFNHPFAENVIAWAALSMFAVINAGLAVAAMFLPSRPNP